MKRVAVITTGGTIASDTKGSSGRLDSGVIQGNELLRLLNIQQEDITLDVYEVFQLPSLHMTSDHLFQLKQKVEVLLREDIDGVVITHGTDSLEETAYFLNLTIHDERPVIVTGAQRAPKAIGTDAYANMKQSIQLAVDPSSDNLGVVVVFNERIYHSKYVKKVHASNVQGFDSFGYGYLGIMDNERPYIFQKPVREDIFELISEAPPKVAIYKSYLGAEEDLFSEALFTAYDGLVLEGAGRGQIAVGFVPVVKRLLAEGVPVVLTTNAEEGQVHPTYDYEGSAYDLLQAGAVLGRDYDAKKARLKLLVYLASRKEKALRAVFDER
ncbi:asparaginase [Salsuginibacillus halophilus]|uniref:asparaginase n=1 Tax=Salsuginibacillus halophilus TaxID=517424 RepID=A0A2P8HWB5_9BACI|nr:asparaginase [Salsuginibacillus halophilus]PSL50468.1 asparaginase [Salsuginibacillus halophilus]